MLNVKYGLWKILTMSMMLLCSLQSSRFVNGYIIVASSTVAMFLSLSCPLVDVLLDIHANLNLDAWKYVGSDGYIVRNRHVYVCM